MKRIGYLAFAQAHQHLHWVPAALALARRDGVSVDVLSGSRANLTFIRRFDPDGLLNYRYLPFPHRNDGLFNVPRRAPTALLWHPRLMSYDVLVTTETTSSVLKRLPWFRVPMIHLKHGAGDSDVGYNPKHRHFDLTLVNGEKDRERLVAKGLATHDEVKVVGYAKFEAIPPGERLFADDRPVAIYNAHAKAPGSTWFDHAPAIIAEMERLPGWNFVVAPHVKLQGGPRPTSNAPNVHIDMGSERSIDMSYTNGADVYIGDASSQVYEFLRTPRPCIFLNLDKQAWQGVEKFSHWAFGQVIDDIAQLGPALDRASALQPRFEAAQREGLAKSLDPSPVPSSERQADAILDFLARR